MRVARLWILALAATVGACGGDDDDDGGTGPSPVFTSLSLSIPSQTVVAGLTQTITATAKDQNNANMSGLTVTYTSSDQTKATVTNAGVVTGVAAGTARITATGVVGTVTKTANVDVTVVAPSATATVAATAQSTFDPNLVAVTRTGTVTWTFAILHNVQFTDANAPANIPDTGTGSVSRTFNTAGTYSYRCGIHTGMTGTVVVQ